jgi:hypothetical protein
LPSYIWIAFTLPEITHRIRKEGDIAAQVIRCCVSVLIVNKILADVNARTEPISNAELACLSTILDTQSRDVELLLDQPGAVALANMISFIFDEVFTLFPDKIPSDVLDLVRKTLHILSQFLPTQERPLNRPIPIANGSDGEFERTLLSGLHSLLITCIQMATPLVEEVRTSCLRMCLKGLWYFGRASTQLEKLVPLPSHICIASYDPEVNRHIGEHPDLTVRVVGHCVRVLTIIQLAAHINSCTDPISDAKLVTENPGMELHLSRPNAVTFALANMISFMVDEVGVLVTDTVPQDILDVMQETCCFISLALPAHNLHLARAVTIIDGSNAEKFERILLSSLHDLLNACIQMTSLLREVVCTSSLRVCLKGLWYFGREVNRLGNSVPLPPHIRMAFSDPEVTRYMRKHPDITVRVIGHCVGALVVTKLAATINSCTDPITDEELACLSASLGPESCDETLFLRQPGIVAHMNMISLTFNTLVADIIPPDVLDLVQQTFGILSHSLPIQENTKLQLDQPAQPILMIDGSDGQFERVLLSRLLHLHELCLQYPPLFDGDVHNSCLRICVKGLWYFGLAFNRLGNAVPLQPAFTNPRMVYTPFNPSDPAPGQMAHCLRALVINKLAADLNSRDVPINDVELTYLSAILDTKKHDVMLLLSHQGIIQLVNLVSLVLDDIFDLPLCELASDVLDVLSQTLGILSQAIPTQLSAEMQLDTLMDVSTGRSKLNL